MSTFDPTPYADEPIGYRLPGETLAEGMFLIWPLLGAADLGALRARGEDHFGDGKHVSPIPAQLLSAWAGPLILPSFPPLIGRVLAIHRDFLPLAGFPCTLGALEDRLEIIQVQQAVFDHAGVAGRRVIL